MYHYYYYTQGCANKLGASALPHLGGVLARGSWHQATDSAQLLQPLILARGTSSHPQCQLSSLQPPSPCPLEGPPELGLGPALRRAQHGLMLCSHHP